MLVAMILGGAAALVLLVGAIYWATRRYRSRRRIAPSASYRPAGGSGYPLMFPGSVVAAPAEGEGPVEIPLLSLRMRGDGAS